MSYICKRFEDENCVKLIIKKILIYMKKDIELFLGNFLEYSFMGEFLGYDFNGYKWNVQVCRLREK